MLVARLAAADSCNARLRAADKKEKLREFPTPGRPVNEQLFAISREKIREFPALARPVDELPAINAEPQTPLGALPLAQPRKYFRLHPRRHFVRLPVWWQ